MKISQKQRISHLVRVVEKFCIYNFLLADESSAVKENKLDKIREILDKIAIEMFNAQKENDELIQVKT